MIAESEAIAKLVKRRHHCDKPTALDPRDSANVNSGGVCSRACQHRKCIRCVHGRNWKGLVAVTEELASDIELRSADDSRPQLVRSIVEGNLQGRPLQVHIDEEFVFDLEGLTCVDHRLVNSSLSLHPLNAKRIKPSQQAIKRLTVMHEQLNLKLHTAKRSDTL